MICSPSSARRRYSVQPSDPIVVKGYRFLLFAKIICKNISKNLSKKTCAANIVRTS